MNKIDYNIRKKREKEAHRQNEKYDFDQYQWLRHGLSEKKGAEFPIRTPAAVPSVEPVFAGIVAPPES